MSTNTNNKQKKSPDSDESNELTEDEVIDNGLESKLKMIEGFSAAEFKYFLTQQAVTTQQLSEKTGKIRSYMSQIPRIAEQQKKAIPFWFMEALIEVMTETKFKLLRKMYQRSK